MNLIERAKQYVGGEEILRDWIGNGGVTVDPEKAQSRSDACFLCPQNQPGFVPVEAVSVAIKKVVELKNNLQLRVVGEKRLHTCQACQCPLRTKVWIPIERIVPDEETSVKLDKLCWILEELKQL